MIRSGSRAVRAAWVALVVTLLAGVAWGAHQPFSWDLDNIAPGSVLKGLQAHFGTRWYSSYGPLPYLVIGAFYLLMLAPMRAVGEFVHPVANYPWGFAHPDISIPALILAARLVTMTLALWAASALGRGAAEGTIARRWLVPLLVLGSPVFVYYARTTNVDMYYVAWLAVAFHLLEREVPETRALALSAAAAMCAVCSKEQAAPLAAVAIGSAMMRAWRLPGGARAALGVAGAAIATYALLWKLPFGFEGWRGHHDFIFHVARYPRAYPLSLAGVETMAARFAQLTPVALGWPVIAGLALAALTRPSLAGMGARAFAVALYLVGFLGPVGYIYPRFLLPVLLVAVPIALRGWDRALELAGTPALRAFGIAALLAACLTGGPNLTRVQLRDVRYEVGEWLGRLPAGTRVEVAGNPRYQAHVPRHLSVTYITPESLAVAPRGPVGDVVLLSMYDDRYFRDEPIPRAAWWEPLSGGGEYRRRVWRSRGDLGNVRDLFVSPMIFVWTRNRLAASDSLARARAR